MRTVAVFLGGVILSVVASVAFERVVDPDAPRLIVRAFTTPTTGPEWSDIAGQLRRSAWLRTYIVNRLAGFVVGAFVGLRSRHQPRIVCRGLSSRSAPVHLFHPLSEALESLCVGDFGSPSRRLLALLGGAGGEASACGESAGGDRLTSNTAAWVVSAWENWIAHARPSRPRIFISIHRSRG
jgi:hypothetical protein